MKKRILAALLVFVALLTGCSRKETTGQWPSQKIEIDVCYTAGGTADTVARQLSALMSQQLSTTFNLVNVTGGSGSIAGQQVYAAAHDGYTWLGDVAHTVSGWRTLGYADLGWEDFYGFYAASSPYVLFVSGNSPYQTAQQLFDAMRGDPSMKWGNAGLGSINQLTGSLMLEKLGLNSEEQKEDTNYLDGIQGLLKTKDGQQLNLDNIGTTPLAEKVKTKACDLVLKQGLNFIS